MKSFSKSSSYLIRNQYTFCFRMHIPKDLQSAIGRKEIRRSLQSVQLGIAKYKSREIAGNLQRLFRKMRTMGDDMTQLDHKRIQEIINRHIREELDRAEDIEQVPSSGHQI